MNACRISGRVMRRTDGQAVPIPRCCPNAGIKPLRVGDVGLWSDTPRRRDAAIEPGTPREHEAAVKTIAQGRPGVAPVEPVVTCCCAFISHIRLRADPALGFP